MKFIRATITGLISIATIYFIPFTAEIIKRLLSGIPATAGGKGVIPAIIQLAIALFLWWLLYLVTGRRSKKA